MDLSDYWDTGEWNVLSTSAKLNSRYYNCCKEAYMDLEFTIDVERKTATYKSAIILPCFVLMLSTLGSFLLTPDCGEKICLNGFALIGSIIFLIYLSTTLPFHDDSVPLVGIN